MASELIWPPALNAPWCWKIPELITCAHKNSPPLRQAVGTFLPVPGYSSPAQYKLSCTRRAGLLTESRQGPYHVTGACWAVPPPPSSNKPWDSRPLSRGRTQAQDAASHNPSPILLQERCSRGCKEFADTCWTSRLAPSGTSARKAWEILAACGWVTGVDEPRSSAQEFGNKRQDFPKRAANRSL